MARYYVLALFLIACCTTSNAVAQSFSAPETANAGATITIELQGNFDNRDFMTIVPPDKPEGKYDRYVYASSNSVTMPVPEIPGDYEIRLLDDATPYPTLHKSTLVVEPVSAELTADEQINIGVRFEVHWQGPDNRQDFITIVPADAPEKEYGSYSYTSSGNPVTLKAPAEPGTYQIRYITGGKHFTLSSRNVEVLDVSATLQFEPTADIGATIPITWSGPNNEQDFITIVPTGSDESAYDNYTYTTRGSPLNLKLPDNPGQYEIRYLTPAQGGYRVLGSGPIQIGDATASIAAVTEALAGSTIKVTWSGPNNSQDYITVVETDAENRQYKDYFYTQGDKTEDEINLPDTPGDYELRYVTGQEYRILARSPIKAVPVSASLSAPDTVEAGTNFEVQWEGPNNRVDYIATTDVGNSDNYHTYSYTKRGNPLTLPAPRTPGDYEIHYITGLEETSLASITLTVTPSQTPGSLRVLSQSETEQTQMSSYGAVELILDASGSMLQRLDGERRIDIAKRTLSDLVSNQLPDNVQYALRVFGHRKPDACDTELVQALAPLERSAASETINNIQAMNLAKTPIAESLSLVASDLAGVEGETLVILVTDGEETCDGDPSQAIAELRDSGFNVRINIIGFAIDEYALKQIFAQWAEQGGGAYFDANNSDALSTALQQSLEVTFSIFDSEGSNVGSGSVNGDAITLAPGEYTVKVGTDEHMVSITSEEDSILSL